MRKKFLALTTFHNPFYSHWSLPLIFEFLLSILCQFVLSLGSLFYLLLRARITAQLICSPVSVSKFLILFFVSFHSFALLCYVFLSRSLTFRKSLTDAFIKLGVSPFFSYQILFVSGFFCLLHLQTHSWTLRALQVKLSLLKSTLKLLELKSHFI
jgi:hypothetical protein